MSPRRRTPPSGPSPGMGRIRKAAIIAVLTAAFGLGVGICPVGCNLEESSGLALLFKLRGERRPPSSVVIVSEDEGSSADLGLPRDPRDWPRAYHARLIDKLVSRGARVIAFDQFFVEVRSAANNRKLAEAIAEAGNVVLTGSLEMQVMALKGSSGRVERRMTVEKLIPPTPALAQRAVSFGPFPLPKVPVTVSRYWTFRPGVGVPTLPVVVLQVYALPAYGDLVGLLKQVCSREAASRGLAPLPGPVQDAVNRLIALNGQKIFGADAVNGLSRAMRKALGNGSPLAQPALDALNERATRSPGMRRLHLLKALVNAYRDGDSRYLNYYGPAQTITTVPYAEVLRREHPRDVNGNPVDFKGKVVFVGESNRDSQRRGDNYHTFYSSPDGLDLSGVEIAATAFANLWEGVSLWPVGLVGYALILTLFGLLVGTACYLLGPVTAVVCMGGLIASYAVIATYEFMQSSLWLPVIVPVAFQVPFAFVTAVLWKYFDARKVEAAHERLKEIDRLKTLFLSQVSHELKTPLSSIKGFVDNMLDGLTGELAERQRDYLTRVRTNANRLSRMISNMLDLSRIESGTHHLERTPLPVCELVDEAVKQFLPIAESRRLTLEVVCPDPTVRILADHDKFIQVITNLVDNAIKFTPPGGRITAAVSLPHPSRVAVTVRDTGPGIPAGVRAHRLFEPFYQAGQSTGYAAGLGLGLSIVKTLVDLHEGTISVVSEEGKGAEFRILLPVVRDDAPGPASGQRTGDGSPVTPDGDRRPVRPGGGDD